MQDPLQLLHDYIEQRKLWSKEITLKRDASLHQPGDHDDKVYYVVSGSIYYAVTLDDEREQVIRFGYSGNFVAALDSFLGNRPTIFHTRALQRTVLKAIDRKTCREVIRSSTELQAAWDQILNGLYLGQLEREIDLLTTDAQERYRRVWERSPRLFQEIPAKYIANYLRMSPETLSRIRGNS